MTVTLDDIFPQIDKPSRYLGSEINRIKKDPEEVDLKIALAFPDLYEIGTSHFGIQILYHILNQNPRIAAERVFAPALDMAAGLKKNNLPLFSLENKIPLQAFDILGFSLLYELNYTNVLMMLSLADIPFYSAQRDANSPILIAGGPCTCNPEPLAEIFDAFVIGDGEAVIVEMSRVYLALKDGGSLTRSRLLREWSEIEGVYVPEFYKTEWTADGFQITLPRESAPSKIRRTVLADLDTALFPTAPIIPWGKPVHDRLRIEISRGCSRGCRFCQAGMIYRPVRERSLETLSGLAEKALSQTGYEELSLLSLSTGDYGCLIPLMEFLMSNANPHPAAVSLPSIRAEALTPQLMQLIKTVRKTGFTIAPEAGSQRLRNVINKNLTEEDIVKAVGDALNLGWQGIKLYFMVGLPTETMEDLQGIVDLVKTLLRLQGKSRRPQQISVSVASFIPKPHTPFQWAPQDTLEAADEKIHWLKDRLHFSRVKVKWQNPQTSVLEGLWARGDRRLSKLLIRAFEKGCVFDGWSDQFRYDLWVEAMKETGIDPGFFTTRKRSVTEPLPWDHVDMRVTRTFLKKEWEKSMSGALTPDCRRGKCSDCGVCDHEQISPILFESESSPALINPPEDRPSGESVKIMLGFRKTGQARFIGHLEMVNLFLRSLRRSGIPVKYSEGFHPKPRMSFKDTLPVGMESEEEILTLSVADMSCDEIMERLNDKLPDGFTILFCRPVSGKAESGKGMESRYAIILKDGFFDEKTIESFFKNESFIFTRINHKGKSATINLKEFVHELSLESPQHLVISLACHDEITIRPMEILRRVFLMEEDRARTARIVKLAPIQR